MPTYNGSQAFTGKGSTLSIGPAVATAGTFTSGATTITAISAGVISLVAGSLLSGPGIAAGTTVVSVSGTTATISTATTAAGTSFFYQTTLGEVRGLTQSGAEAAEEDVTNLQSTGKEVITTIIDEGTYDFTCNRVAGDAGQQLFQAAYVNQTKLTLVITSGKGPTQTSVGDSWVGSCYAKSRGYVFEPTKAQQFSGKIRITNALVFTAGS